MDIILILVILLGIFVGYKKGFINVIFSIIGIFLAIILALLTYKPVVKYIIPKTGFDVTVSNYVQSKVKNNETSINLPESLQNYIGSDIIINQSSSTMVEKITNFIVNIITIIILIMLFYIVVLIVKFILNGIAKLPVLNITNKIAGAALGGIKNCAVILIFFSLISFLSLIGKAESVVKFIDNSIISKQIYNNNPISKVIVIKQTKDINENNNVEEIEK